MHATALELSPIARRSDHLASGVPIAGVQRAREANDEPASTSARDHLSMDGPGRSSPLIGGEGRSQSLARSTGIAHRQPEQRQLVWNVALAQPGMTPAAMAALLKVSESIVGKQMALHRKVTVVLEKFDPRGPDELALIVGGEPDLVHRTARAISAVERARLSAVHSSTTRQGNGSNEPAAIVTDHTAPPIIGLTDGERATRDRSAIGSTDRAGDDSAGFKRDQNIARILQALLLHGKYDGVTELANKTKLSHATVVYLLRWLNLRNIEAQDAYRAGTHIFPDDAPISDADYKRVEAAVIANPKLGASGIADLLHRVFLRVDTVLINRGWRTLAAREAFSEARRSEITRSSTS